MKFLILLLAVSGLLANSLSLKDEQDLLREIDNLCGDTWCEGDSDFAFKNFTCDFSQHSCTMIFDEIPCGMISENNEALPKLERQCTLNQLANSDQLFVRAGDKEISIDWDFYGRLGKCVNQPSEEVDDCYSLHRDSN